MSFVTLKQTESFKTPPRRPPVSSLFEEQIVSLYISTLLIWEGLSLLGLGPGQLCGKAIEEAGTEEEQEAVVGEAVAAGGKDVAGFCGTSDCGDTGGGGDSGSGGRSSKTSSSVTSSSPSSTVGSIYENYY